MSAREEAVRRAHRALEAARGTDETVEHPGYELLEAYVDGRLDARERAEVDLMAAQSSAVAEDLADLKALRDGMRDEPAAAPAPVRRQVVWGRRVALAAGIAASLALVVWLGGRGIGGNHPAQSAEAPGATAESLPPAASNLTNEERTQVDQRIANGKVRVPDAVVALAGETGTLLGPGVTAPTFGPVAPLGTAVLSTRPTFQWSASGADRFTVAVFDEGFTEVARGTNISGTSWTPPVDLPRGAIYRWQITAHRASGDLTAPAPPLPEARFSVLDARMAATVSDQRTRLADEPLALGILLADAGLLTDARIELARAQQTPATASAATTLMQSLSGR